MLFRSDWIGLRVTYKGKVTDIYINQLADGRLMHLNSWIDADGWNTDAYLLAVSYPAGSGPENFSDLFIGHGSALRRNGDVWFSSLSKLNVVSNDNGVKAAGQPRINFKLKDKKGRLTAHKNK